MNPSDVVRGVWCSFCDSLESFACNFIKLNTVDEHVYWKCVFNLRLQIYPSALICFNYIKFQHIYWLEIFF